MGIYYHLKEIKTRTVYLILSFFLTFCCSVFFSIETIYFFVKPFLRTDKTEKEKDVYRFLQESKEILLERNPIYRENIDTFLSTNPELLRYNIQKGFIFTEPTEGLYSTLKISLLLSFCISTLYLFYVLWVFFTPSLYNFEKKRFSLFFFFFIFSFLLGSLLFYFCLLPILSKFLLGYEIKDNPLISISLEPKIQSYVDWSVSIFLSFQIVLQIPFLGVLLFYLKVLSKKSLPRKRKFFFLFFLLLSAFLSPPEFFMEFLLLCFFMSVFEILVFFGFLYNKIQCIKGV